MEFSTYTELGDQMKEKLNFVKLWYFFDITLSTLTSEEKVTGNHHLGVITLNYALNFERS